MASSWPIKSKLLRFCFGPLQKARLAAMLRGALFALVFASCAMAGDRSVPEIWREALALVERGRFAEALPLLQQLHAQLPQETGITFELAHAHYQLSQDRRARALFKKAQSQSKVAGEKAVAQRYLDLLQARQKWHFQLAGGPLPFSAASRRKTADYVTLGGLPFKLDKAEKSGPGFALDIGARYRNALGAQWRYALDFGLAGEAFRNRKWNDYTAYIDQNLAYLLDDRSEIAAGFSLRHRWLGEKPYRAEYGPYLSYSRLLDQRNLLHLRGELLRREALGAGRGKSNIYRARLHLSHRLDAATRLHSGLGFDLLRNRLPHEAGKILSLRLGVDRQIGALHLSLNLRHLIERRSAPDPVFGLRRKDRESSLTLALSHEEWQIMGLKPELGLLFERRSSNIALHDWRGKSLSLLFSKRF